MAIGLGSRKEIKVVFFYFASDPDIDLNSRIVTIVRYSGTSVV